MIKAQPLAPISELSLSTLIGPDNQVDQNDYSGSIELAIGIEDIPVSGEILSLILQTQENGTGAVLTPAGHLILFDANPGVTAGDTALTASEWGWVIGTVEITATDWVSDANGAVAFKQVAIPFHEVTSLYAVWLHTSATSFNDAGGDNERLHLNLWYRRDS